MFSAKDSICNIRAIRKRECSNGATGALPIDQLKTLARKRQRTGTQCSQTPLSNNQALQTDGKKSVKFDLCKNTYQESPLSIKEVGQGWLTSVESQRIKNELRVTVLALQHGLLDRDAVCIRGLEVHADPVLSEKKRTKCRAFATRILQQQSFLKAMMGKVNEHILAKLSKLLSGEDATQAIQYGIQDAHVARIIHSIQSTDVPVSIRSTDASDVKGTVDIPGLSMFSLFREGLAGVSDCQLNGIDGN